MRCVLLRLLAYDKCIAREICRRRWSSPLFLEEPIFVIRMHLGFNRVGLSFLFAQWPFIVLLCHTMDDTVSARLAISLSFGLFLCASFR